MQTESQAISAAEAMQLEDRFGAHNYHPLPVVIARGDGPFLYDTEGRQYFDFLSAYSAANQGHCHPHIIDAFVAQARTLTLTSRAMYNNRLGEAEKFICGFFGYDKTLMMNSGAEANETALKLARKWAYKVKGTAEDKAVVLCAENNFHGRTLAMVSASSDPDARNHYGPFLPGWQQIPFNNLAALEQALQADPNICAYLFEPIQGEAGILIPDEGYLAGVRALCTKYNVLMMADEIQSGAGRAGRMLACDHENVRPDVLILGKALSGGTMPVSAVLASDEVMLTIRPGEHGSTYGGNPLASAVAIASLEVLRDEDLAGNSERMGVIFRERMQELQTRLPFIAAVRGRGLMNAVVIQPMSNGKTAWDVCIALMENGLLAKPTHGDTIRFSPPLVITEEQMLNACDIIEDTLSSFITA
ncbi:MAG: ornithine--oxo-acid transaminase [Bacteroidota bacterium]